MSARPKFDSLHFARAGDECSGQAPLAGFERLVDFVPESGAEVIYRVRGGIDRGRPTLWLDIDVTVSLVCQRCLSRYREQITVRRGLPVARDEAQLALWERDDPLLDALVAEPEMDVLTLVEDEILLSLPVAPRHPEGECGQAD